MLWILYALIVLFLLCVVMGGVLIRSVLGRSKDQSDGLYTREKLPVRYGEFSQRTKNEYGWFMEQKLEKLEMTSRDGLKLSAHLLDVEGEARGTVVVVHGYRSCGMNYFKIARFYHEMGFRLLMPDNRAHGQSEGKMLGFGWKDRLDIIDWVKKLDARFGGPVLLHGISMGSATVMNASGDPELPGCVRAIVADCGYTSAWDEFAGKLRSMYHLPVFPLLYVTSAMNKVINGWTFKENAPLRMVTRAKVPMLFIHGERDDFVPYEMGPRLYAACAAPKEFLSVPTAAHARAYSEDKENYEAAIRRLITRARM